MGEQIDVVAEVRAGRSIRPRQLARQVNVPAATIYAKIERGEIKAIRLGRVLTIPPEAAARLLGLA